MSSCKKCVWGRSVAKKQILGVTGLLLCGFIIAHLAGNLLIYAGSDWYNKYSHALISNPLIYLAEAGLVALFLTHLCLAMKITYENKKARPQGYYMSKKTGNPNGSNLASATMPYTGIAILLFTVLHLICIKYGPVYTTTVDGVEMRDVYKLVIEYFQSPLNVAWYVLAVSLLGFHVGHGFWSAFQSLGLYHKRHSPCLRKVAKAFGLIIALGYAALPLWSYFYAGAHL
jgi:succinate dehydrogenase / fumarate reductase, cytochrome b subunit